MHELSARDLRRSRPFHTIIATVWALLALLSALLLLVHLDGVDRPALGSAQYVLTGLSLAWAGTIWTAYWAPRLTLAFGVLLGLLRGFTEVGPDLPPMGFVAAAFAVVALVWIAWRDSRARPHGPHVTLSTANQWLGSQLQAEARFSFRVGVGLGVAGVGLGLALLGIHQYQLDGVVGLEQASEETTLPIIEVHEDVVVVEWEGERLLFDAHYDADHAVGDPFPVLINGSIIKPAGYGRDNPSWLLGLALLAPFLGVAGGLRYGRRLLERHRLVHRGGPSAAVRFLWLDDGGLILPVDGDSPRLRFHGGSSLGMSWASDDTVGEDGALTLVGKSWAQGSTVALVNASRTLAHVGEIDYSRPYRDAVWAAEADIDNTRRGTRRALLWFDDYRGWLHWGLIGVAVVGAAIFLLLF